MPEPGRREEALGESVMVCLDANIVIYLVEQNPFWEPKVAVLELRFSVAPKGPKQESPGQSPGDSIRMKIRPALKGRNKILVHTLVVPLQGVAILITQSSPQGVALGWHVAAPSGRIPRSATPKKPRGVPPRFDVDLQESKRRWPAPRE